METENQQEMFSAPRKAHIVEAASRRFRFTERPLTSKAHQIKEAANNPFFKSACA